MKAPAVTRLAPGAYRVEIDGRADIVYVAEDGTHRWAWCRGQLFLESDRSPGTSASRREVLESVIAPMPAHVLKINVRRGDAVSKGDVVVVLEAMKMELPLRAGADGVVKAVHCAEGAMVGPEQLLVEFEEGKP